ncbi:PilN domain-containing protein [uncultured Phascolarctobacterium sp.]|uniref:PilN domain-containing protein n=1 Tax=uncultured Phascolarctobacterium sp. TaxID=512296 RepID=UPI0025E6093A|nr:PilN domain-containing protein [uncultured Phascolarctobacterium sp.]
MMKHGKSISVEELFEPVLCALRCRWRRKQALLLLSLQTGQVAYWQNGEHSWQEQLNDECLADKQRLTDALREILLARDVEEGAAVLLLPAAATVYSEQLLLPLMQQCELQAALKWEVQQSVPWPEEGYTYSFEATEFSEAGEQQCRVTFTALQDTSRIELEHLCSSLLLKLQGILLSDMTLDEAAEGWFSGKSLTPVYRQKQKRLQGIAATFGRYLTKAGYAVLGLAILAYGSAWGGCYLAQHDLLEVEQQLVQNTVWRQRMQESEAVERNCQRLEKLLAAVSKPSKEAVGELERICRQMMPGCWLTLLEYNGSKKPLVLQGQAVDNLALESFVEQLQKCGIYSRVELLQSQQQGNVLVYKLQLQMKEGKQ